MKINISKDDMIQLEEINDTIELKVSDTKKFYLKFKNDKLKIGIRNNTIKTSHENLYINWYTLDSNDLHLLISGKPITPKGNIGKE